MRELKYDPDVGRALLASASRCLTNASSTIEDAALLVANARFDRGYALSILAQEECSKCFLLSNCAGQHRWDSAVYESLTHHEKKQALVHVMLHYVEWFEAHNKAALALNATQLIPAPVSYLPTTAVFQSWVADAQRKIVKGRSIDRAKQRALYVAVNQCGKVSSQPNCTKVEAESELEQARLFQRVAEMQLNHVVGSINGKGA